VRAAERSREKKWRRREGKKQKISFLGQKGDYRCGNP
jgi:hypothetical protein